MVEPWILKVRVREAFSTQHLAQDANRLNKDAISQSPDALGFFCCCLLKNQPSGHWDASIFLHFCAVLAIRTNFPWFALSLVYRELMMISVIENDQLTSLHLSDSCFRSLFQCF